MQLLSVRHQINQAAKQADDFDLSSQASKRRLLSLAYLLISKSAQHQLPPPRRSAKRDAGSLVLCYFSRYLSHKGALQASLTCTCGCALVAEKGAELESSLQNLHSRWQKEVVGNSQSLNT